MMNQKKDMLVVFVGIVIFVTNISQLPRFVELGITQLITYAVWGVLFLWLILRNGKIVFGKKILYIIMTSFIILGLSFFQTIFLKGNYLETRIIYSFCISIFVLFVSSLIPKVILEDKNMNYVLKMYFISISFVALGVYMDSFANGFDIMSRTYAYGAKNSVSQILLTGICCVFFLNFRLKLFNIGKYLGAILISILLIMLKSRASLLGLVLLVILLLTSKYVKRNEKIVVFLLVISSVVIVLNNENLYDIIVNGVILGGREGGNIADISSGRTEQWKIAPQLISEHILFGRGAYKLEAFPISVLVQMGCITGGIILGMAIYPCLFAYKRVKEGKIYFLLLTVATIYFCNGFFEELSPFGPGVKCYFLWFLFGVLVNRRKGEETFERTHIR